MNIKRLIESVDTALDAARKPVNTRLKPFRARPRKITMLSPSQTDSLQTISSRAPLQFQTSAQSQEESPATQPFFQSFLPRFLLYASARQSKSPLLSRMKTVTTSSLSVRKCLLTLFLTTEQLTLATLFPSSKDLRISSRIPNRCITGKTSELLCFGKGVFC